MDEILTVLAGIAAAVVTAWEWLMDEAGVELSALEGGAAALRLVVAMLCGSVIGLERESRGRPAGLRTHMLVALASALFALVALEVLATHAPGQGHLRIDPLRLIEAVTSGVAFLAAGSIIVTQGSVRGITTGAGMWLAGAIGLACGLGFFQLALLSTLFAMVVLDLLRRLDVWMENRRERREQEAPEDD